MKEVIIYRTELLLAHGSGSVRVRQGRGHSPMQWCGSCTAAALPAPGVGAVFDSTSSEQSLSLGLETSAGESRVPEL